MYRLEEILQKICDGVSLGMLCVSGGRMERPALSAATPGSWLTIAQSQPVSIIPSRSR